MQAIIEHVEHPFGRGSLTSTGAQYCTEVSSAKNVYSTVESVVVAPPTLGNLIEVEVAVTWSQKSAGATDKAVGVVQVKNASDTWTAIMTEVTNGTAGTTYEEKTYSGRLALSSIPIRPPLEFRVQVKSNSTNDNATAKVKNSSYVKLIYADS